MWGEDKTYNGMLEALEFEAAVVDQVPSVPCYGLLVLCREYG